MSESMTKITFSPPEAKTPKPTDQHANPNTTYTITVKTSNRFGAGTDANIFCEITGEKGKSHTYKLVDSITHKNKFETNSTDVFVFPDQKRLGDLFELKIWHDNKGMGADWHCAYVEVLDSVDELTYTFPCGHWFAAGKSDGQVLRYLMCTKKGVKADQQWGLRYVTQEDGTRVAHVYMPTMEYIRDSAAMCMHSERKWLRDFLGELLGTMVLVMISAHGVKNRKSHDFLGELLGTTVSGVGNHVLMAVGYSNCCETIPPNNVNSPHTGWVITFCHGSVAIPLIIDGACAQLVLSRGSFSNWVQVSFACGMGITLGVYLSGNSSGGHINPAVTMVMVFLGRTTWRMLPVYWLAQYLGAFLGAGIVFAVYYDAINAFDGGIRQVFGPQATAGIFATYPQDFLYTGSGWYDQIVGTAVLTQLIFAITDPRNHAVPRFIIPLLVGLIVVLIGMSLGFNCGFAINPARDLGPRIFTAIVGYGPDVFSYRDYNWFWVPIVGPHIGAILGTIIYMLFVGLHWPQTFQASEIARKKSQMSHVDLDRPSELLDPNALHPGSAASNAVTKKISNVKKMSKDFTNINELREYYNSLKDPPPPVNLVERF